MVAINIFETNADFPGETRNTTTAKVCRNNGSDSCAMLFSMGESIHSRETVHFNTKTLSLFSYC